ncbi:hypothetical protein HQ571_04090 [Candidatus Kuenenbacteria bacterium]|nr:hypothetical protein [Candidatus Kuenenbacteria bacterium]
MQKTVQLEKPRLFVIRIISQVRNATNQELADHGLAIGNNLDNEPLSPRHKWKQDEDGKRSRYYRIPDGKWPVYIALSKELALKNLFLKNRPDGSVTYIAELDIEKHQLGTNVAFEHQDPGEPLAVIKETTLRIEEGADGKFCLRTDVPKDKLMANLRDRFDDEGKLQGNEKLGGEFYLDDYNSPSDFENEWIYRVKDGKPVEITSEIALLRENNEARAEITRKLK